MGGSPVPHDQSTGGTILAVRRFDWFNFATRISFACALILAAVWIVSCSTNFTIGHGYYRSTPQEVDGHYREVALRRGAFEYQNQ